MVVLRRIWAAWKQLGRWMGDMLARVVLTIFYFTIFMPFGLGMRLFGGDPLDIKSRANSGWRERKTNDLTLDDARRLS